MRITCPSCGSEYPVEAGLIESDGKRLAQLTGEMDPALARAGLAYLRLFKPPKTSLRTARAHKILHELLDLVRAGTVCRDERGGMHRPASPAVWIAGIEQMLHAPANLRLPLANHNYLRQVVYGLAEQANAAQEKQTEADRRAVRRTGEATQASEHLKWLEAQLARGFMTRDKYDSEVAAHQARHAKPAEQRSVPHPDFCVQPDKCAGLSSCPRRVSCTE